MTDFAFDRKPYFYFNWSRIVLCLVWMAGLLFGCIIALTGNSVFLAWMRSAVFQPVSIVGLLVSVFLPLLLTYISFVIKKPIILLIVCFLKAAAFAFCGTLIHQCYGNASWLVGYLYLFSDSFFAIFLFALWYRRLDCSRTTGSFELPLCVLVGVLLAAVEYLLVSPLLLGLF